MHVPNVSAEKRPNADHSADRDQEAADHEDDGGSKCDERGDNNDDDGRAVSWRHVSRCDRHPGRELPSALIVVVLFIREQLPITSSPHIPGKPTLLLPDVREGTKEMVGAATGGQAKVDLLPRHWSRPGRGCALIFSSLLSFITKCCRLPLTRDSVTIPFLICDKAALWSLEMQLTRRALMSIRLGTQLSQNVAPKLGDNIVSPSAACLAVFGLGLSLFSLYQLDSCSRKRLFSIPMIRS